jgi:hypothetical protein
MKKYIVLTMMLVLSVVAGAESITRQQAEQLARQFITKQGMYGALSQAEPHQARDRALLKGSSQDGCYYVFNVGTNEGFVIVSGDDRTPAVLGYSDKGSFDMDRLPSNVAAWLEGYADQIRYLRKKASAEPTAPVSVRSDAPLMKMTRAPWAVKKEPRPAISPMITSKWDQFSPFNDLCPVVDGQHCVTGCIATALAQIMYYHKWPQAATTEIPGYTVKGKSVSYPGLPATTFNWAAMTDNPASGTSAGDAVAVLMQYCSYGCKADFGIDNTSIYNNEPENALKNYFHYGAGVKYVERQTYSNENWESLIYTELEANRPVLYTGQSYVAELDGNVGHAFVVHGYDGNGYYAVNWGWGQSVDQDGYYLLDAMDPADLGAGGGVGGYNSGQTAIIGISKDDVETYQVTDEQVVLTTTDISLIDDEYVLSDGYYAVSFKCEFVNYLSNTYEFDLNFKLYKDNEYQGFLLNAGDLRNTLPPMYYINQINLYLPAWLPGKYKLVPVSRKLGEGEYNENIGSEQFYLTAVVSADKKLKLYVGDPEGTEPDPQPDPDPDPEVTQEQLDQLSTAVTSASAQLATLTDLAADKKKALDGYQSATKTINDDIKPVIASLKALDDKLQKDEYLTADQKKEFEDRRQKLWQSLSSISESVVTLDAILSTDQKTVSGVETDIAGISEALKTLAAAIPTITKKEDLEKAQIQYNNCIAAITADDAKLKAIDTATLEATLKTLSVSDIATDTKTLGADIDKAISTAKESAQQQEEQKKLAKAKDRLQKAVDNLIAQVKTHQLAYDDALSHVIELEKQLEAINTATESLAAKIAEIEALIEANRPEARTRNLSDEDYQKAVGSLEIFKEELAVAVENRDILTEQLGILKDYAADVENILNVEKQQLATAEAMVSENVDEVNAMAESLEDFAPQAEKLFTEEVDALVETIGVVANNVVIANDHLTYYDGKSDELRTLVEENVASIGTLTIDENEVEGRYDMQGRKVDSGQKGVQILRLKNGQTRKVYVR